MKIAARAGPDRHSMVVDVEIPLRELLPRVVARLDRPCARAVRRAERDREFIVVHLRSRRSLDAFGRSEARAGGPAKRSVRVYPIYVPGVRTETLVAALKLAWLAAEPWVPWYSVKPMNEPRGTMKFLDYSKSLSPAP